ncbi:MAG: hypothetical protein K6U80_17485 [Firmicutes bacterium]|nr:hypothetical protein [Bacillota bacterium]
MSRVVFLGFPYYGHTHPSLPVVKELARRGEEVVYYSIEAFRPKIEAAGAIFRSYRIPRMEIVEQPLAGFTLTDLQKGARGIYDLNTTIDGFVNNLALYLEIMKESPVDLTREIKELAPDYIIHDSYAYWGKVIAKRLGIPAITSVTIFAYCDRIYEEQPAFVIKNILADEWVVSKVLKPFDHKPFILLVFLILTCYPLNIW